MTPKAHARYQAALSHLKRYAAALHREIADGSFYRRSWMQRRKMVGRIRRLYRKLVGPLDAALVRSAVAAAGALSLAACNPLTEGPDGDGTGGLPPGPAQTLGEPSFAPVQLNPFGLAPEDWSEGADSSFQFAASSLTAADIDGDGDLDLFAAGVLTDPAGLLLLKNTGTPGNPSFAAPVADPYGLSLTGGLDSSGYDPYSYMPYGSVREYTIRALAFGDLDSDGDLDLVATGTYYYNDYGSGAFGGPFPRVFTAENTGSATVPEFQGLYQLGGIGATGYYDIGQVSLLDLDGDSDPDLLYSYDGEVQQASNETDTEFTIGSSASVTSLADIQQLSFVSLDGTAFSVGDIDGDGDPDILARGYGATQADNEFQLFENTGSAAAPAFSSTAVVDPFGLSIAAGDTVFRPLLADLDSDGDQDVIAFLWRETSPGNLGLYAAFWENLDIE